MDLNSPGPDPIPQLPEVAKANSPVFSAREAPTLESEGLPRQSGGVIAWLLAMVIVLLLASILVPRMCEEIQYSLTRGKQRADHDLAAHLLQNASLNEISQASQMVALRIAPSVVIIDVNSAPEEQPLMEDELLQRFGPRSDAIGQGSGVIVDPSGYILTNNHVIRGAKEIRVTLSDGRRLPATITGVDTLTDLALLKVSATNLIAAEWGDSDGLPVGSLIWAFGSPFGLERSVSFGILSAKNRGRIANSPHQDFLQTDAAVNPGNSGGPLVDVEGRVVGINTAIVGQTYSGISFAVPSNVAREVAARLQHGGYVPRAWLGVQLSQVTEEVAARQNLPEVRGALIAQIVQDGRVSPAQQAGLKAGDVVLKWDEAVILEPAMLSQIVARSEIGKTVKVQLIRGGQPMVLEVTLVERPREFN
jgi:S1-C subfamily serine protease